MVAGYNIVDGTKRSKRFHYTRKLLYVRAFFDGECEVFNSGALAGAYLSQMGAPLCARSGQVLKL